MRKYVLFVAVFAMFLAACASKPEAESAAAQAALENAKNAEADVYAPSEFQAAQSALSSAEAEIAAQEENYSFTRDYEQAKALLEEAKTTAESAASNASVAKEEARNESQTLRGEAEAAIQNARDLLAKAPRGKGTRADLEALNADLASAESAFAAANQALNDGRHLDAGNQFREVISQAQSIASDVEQASSRRRR